MLCKCSGKYIDIYFILKMTFCISVVRCLTDKVGATRSFTQVVDRTSLLELLPASQDELPARSMKVISSSSFFFLFFKIF